MACSGQRGKHPGLVQRLGTLAHSLSLNSRAGADRLPGPKSLPTPGPESEATPATQLPRLDLTTGARNQAQTRGTAQPAPATRRAGAAPRRLESGRSPEAAPWQSLCRPTTRWPTPLRQEGPVLPRRRTPPSLSHETAVAAADPGPTTGQPPPHARRCTSHVTGSPHIEAACRTTPRPKATTAVTRVGHSGGRRGPFVAGAEGPEPAGRESQQLHQRTCGHHA